VKFGMVERMRRQDVDVKFSCKMLKVSRSGFYAWKSRPISERQTQNDRLVAKIRAVYDESRRTYGSPRVHAALKEDGVECSENRVARVMKKNKIVSITKKKFRVKTTDSNHSGPIAKRIFETERAKVTLTAPNQVWAGDITYIETREGWLYLSVFLDMYTRKVVGFSMRRDMQAMLVIDAMDMALGRNKVEANTLVAHSDRGVQYAASTYRSQLEGAGILPSMSRKGNCYDNAFVESFFKTLKSELVYQTEFKTRKEAENAIFEYIEVFYNRQRLHSSLGYQSPEDYERMAS
jgi:putative transposase